MKNMKYLLVFFTLSATAVYGQDAKGYIDSFLAERGDYHGPHYHKPIPYYEIERSLNEISGNRIMAHNDTKKIKRIHTLYIGGKKIEKMVSEWDSSDQLIRRIYWSNSNKKVEYYYNYSTGKELAVSYMAQSPFHIDTINIKTIDTATDGELTLEMVLESDYISGNPKHSRNRLYPILKDEKSANDKTYYNKNGYIDSMVTSDGIFRYSFLLKFFYNKDMHLSSVRKTANTRNPNPLTNEISTDTYYYDFTYDKKGNILMEAEIEKTTYQNLNNGDESETKKNIAKATYEYDKDDLLTRYTCYERQNRGPGTDTTICTYSRLSPNLAIVDIYQGKHKENGKNIVHFDEYGNIITEETTGQIKRNEYDFY